MFQIVKHTAITMDGKQELIEVAHQCESWVEAVCLSMTLEAEHLGQLHNGRKIMFDVERIDA